MRPPRLPLLRPRRPVPQPLLPRYPPLRPPHRQWLRSPLLRLPQHHQSRPQHLLLVAPPAAPATVAGVSAAPVAQLAALAAPSAKGIFSVTTVPSKAKVYGDDVYYGTSPLKLELDPGVTVFHFKLDGYKTATQKVSDTARRDHGA